jgi:hypothetical protein
MCKWGRDWSSLTNSSVFHVVINGGKKSEAEVTPLIPSFVEIGQVLQAMKLQHGSHREKSTISFSKKESRLKIQCFLTTNTLLLYYEYQAVNNICGNNCCLQRE